ncbi:MAG: hypothetical protein OXH29_06600 [bacterium]|nr:hypothetical protein [bacterium]
MECRGEVVDSPGSAEVGATEVVFADYDVSVPEVPIVLSAEDHGTVELQLFFTRSP